MAGEQPNGKSANENRQRTVEEMEEELHELLDKYHEWKQEAQDDTNNPRKLGKAYAYGRVITDLEDLVYGR